MYRLSKYIFLLAVICVLSGCKYLRYVPEDKLLLKKASVVSDVKFDDVAFQDYLHQTPNNYFMGIGRLKLAFYSSSDTAKHNKGNEWLRRIGEPPEIYDSLKRVDSEDELRKVMFNKGYLDADVWSEMTVKKRQASVVYHIQGNTPYLVRNYLVSIPDSVADGIINTQAEKDLRFKRGDLFDIDALNEDRNRISRMMRTLGYFRFRRDLLEFTVDSALGTHQVDIEMSLQEKFLQNDSALNLIFSRPVISGITVFVRDYGDKSRLSDLVFDTVVYKGITIIRENSSKVYRPSAIVENIFFDVDSLYNELMVELTNNKLSAMPSVNYVNIEFKEKSVDSLECMIVLSPGKPHTLSADVQVAYSDGDIGVLGGLNYANNNIFKGSETLRIGATGGWEGIGALNNLQNSWRLGGDVSLSFPKLLVPQTKHRNIQNIGSTEVSISTNFQKRPEYDRALFNAAYKYNWRIRRVQFTYSLVDMSYLYLPRVSESFRDRYLQPTSSIKASYEDNYIMRMGFNVTYSDRRASMPNATYFTIRAGAKIAGNLLYGVSNMIGQKKDEYGHYKIFNIAYAQFAKFDFDYVHNVMVSDNVRMAFHAGLGVGVPYGNSTVMPYEERYYAGGANGLRGWAARTLGPGNFKNTSGAIDFERQSGDVKLDLNVEARFHLFWKLEAAVFVDAGNIWTIKDYPEQPTGVFRFDTFYRQIACDYGAGIRLNFDFFVVRLDLGVKLYDPGRSESERFRTELTWKEDFALHFAVGYPF